MNVTTAAATAKLLADAGIQRVFGLPGGEVLVLMDELRRAVPWLESAVAAMRSEGRQVEYIGSILMPIDQVVFTLVAAADEHEIRQLNERAGLPVDRIAKAIALVGPAVIGSPAGGGGPEPRR